VTLFLITSFFAENIYIAVPLVVLASVFVIRTSKDKLKVEETFPELLKLPLMKWLLK
jgi:hypothetical protein